MCIVVRFISGVDVVCIISTYFRRILKFSSIRVRRFSFSRFSWKISGILFFTI